ncbi:MAG: von Willebrand factor type A domain-containing protein [Chitinophagaceae bacterium]|nr:von Willebrand factor type A domain-containing protein [Chitinophagaceae bacterium]
MRSFIWILLLLSAAHVAHAQYYLRGEIRNEQSVLLSGVKIKIGSKPNLIFYSGGSGSFGIPIPRAKDSIHLSFEGYEPFSVYADSRQFQMIQMKASSGTSKLYKNYKASIVKNFSTGFVMNSLGLGESYTGIIENDFIKTNIFPETGFSLNIDNASYSNIRRFINNGMMIPQDAIRIEEMLNYFSLPLPPNSVQQKGGFAYAFEHSSCPWNPQHQLLFLQLQAPTIPLHEVPPSNLVFLIDVSGSMDKPNRLPLLQAGFRLLINNLRPIDTVSVITYGGGVAMVLAPTGGQHKDLIRKAIDSLSAGGDTPGSGAIQLAYETAKKNFIKAGNNRVILATDGDFNVGQSSEKELEELITRYQMSGIYLTCLGVGMGNYKDSKLETLSKKGNGNFAYIDQIREAEKVLVTEFTKNIFTVANDASITLQFNPETVAAYRLIGFDNKKIALADSTSTLEGGEIGSGHAIMAIAEIIPAKDSTNSANTSLAKVILRYKDPSSGVQKEQDFKAYYRGRNIEQTDSTYRFAAAVAMFGNVLRRSKFIHGFQLEDVVLLTKQAVSSKNTLQQEFQQLLEKAIRLYHPSKKKRKSD